MLPASSLRQSLKDIPQRNNATLVGRKKRLLWERKRDVFCVEKRVFVMIKLVCYC